MRFSQRPAISVSRSNAEEGLSGAAWSGGGAKTLPGCGTGVCVAAAGTMVGAEGVTATAGGALGGAGRPANCCSKATTCCARAASCVSRAKMRCSRPGIWASAACTLRTRRKAEIAKRGETSNTTAKRTKKKPAEPVIGVAPELMLLQLNISPGEGQCEASQGLSLSKLRKKSLFSPFFRYRAEFVHA